MRHYFLYGPSGAGKSTVAGLLAEQLALPCFDLDDEIEAAEAGGISGIFDRAGETGFREIERRELARLAGREPDSVIALGGGALLDPQSRELAERTGRVLCLSASLDALIERLQSDPGDRPLLHDNLSIAMKRYLDERAAHYDSFDLKLDTTGLDPTGTTLAAGQVLGLFRITGMGRPYDVRVERGILARIPELLQARGLDGPFALVADANTAGYARQIAVSLERNGRRSAEITIEAGEAHKTVRTVEKLWTAFIEAGLDRGSTVLAVGGGVVGDLVGFAAASFLRGVAWAAVPTSLLAMVDASLGGKTGADLPQGKNLVGAFHPPSLVVADPEALASLPVRELRNGMAEVVKAGVIGDPGLFDRCGGWDGGVPPADWITRGMSVKIRMIEADPFERGVRAALNFGHTVGHAVEHVSGYRLLHGEAVAIGMAVETALAEQIGTAAPGLAAQIAGCLGRNGLPTAIPAELDREAIFRTMHRDKKKRGGLLRFALPERIGAVELVEVEEAQVREVLRV